MSRNDRDSPGIYAFVPVVSRLTQKADNVPDFSQTLSSRAHRWHILSQQKTYKPGRRKKVAFGTVLSTEPFVISIFRRGIIARHAPQRRNRGVVNDFRVRETQIYQLSRLSDLETWHLCERYSGVDVVHGCFTEGGDSVLSVFSLEPLRAKL